ncbi:MAG TPA: hypothetical protein VFE60_17680 [Roseiarcus sp.]|jgi:hypothetical protein|nr:hypothetical protein [Roseiarcus sp.]
MGVIDLREARKRDRTRKTQKANGKQAKLFSQIPLHWLPIIQRAKAFAAIPLLAAISCQMQLDEKSRITITKRTWKLAGDPRTEDQRRSVITALQRVPSIVRLEFRHRVGPKYIAHKGLWWSKAPPKDLLKAHEDDEET